MYIAKYVNVIEYNGNYILVTMTFSFMIQYIYMHTTYCGKICGKKIVICTHFKLIIKMHFKNTTILKQQLYMYSI